MNNLYNTAFWALVNQNQLTVREAEQILKDTDSAKKNELLFSKFQINYNDLPEIFRKGSFLYKIQQPMEETAKDGSSVLRTRNVITTVHQDIIGDALWNEHRLLS